MSSPLYKGIAVALLVVNFIVVGVYASAPSFMPRVATCASLPSSPPPVWPANLSFMAGYVGTSRLTRESLTNGATEEIDFVEGIVFNDTTAEAYVSRT